MHNGWANYGTWLMETWLYEEPTLRKKVRAMVEKAGDRDELTSQIKELIMAEMAEVAWDQIAAAYWAERYPLW